MHFMALQTMIQAWGEGLIMTTREPGKIHLTYSKLHEPTERTLNLLRYYQPTIAKALPKEATA